MSMWGHVEKKIAYAAVIPSKMLLEYECVLFQSKIQQVSPLGPDFAKSKM